MIIQQNVPYDCLKSKIKYKNHDIENLASIENIAQDHKMHQLLETLNRNESKFNRVQFYSQTRIIYIYVSTFVSVNLKLIDTSNTWINEIRDEFELNFSLHVPISQINFMNSFWNTMKWALVQYLCTATTIFWITNKIKKYLFINQYLMAWRIRPLKKI